MLTSSQLEKLADESMEIGGHTMSHPILVRTSPREAEREIAEGRARLEAIVRKRVRLFAYPNGEPVRDYDAHVTLIKRLGFDAAFSTAWGVARAGSDTYHLPRFTPWDVEPWKFCQPARA
jgi:peptidoglycan/xylan/chitin deacetylase (PgdA/CDA1 family)